VGTASEGSGGCRQQVVHALDCGNMHCGNMHLLGLQADLLLAVHILGMSYNRLRNHAHLSKCKVAVSACRRLSRSEPDLPFTRSCKTFYPVPPRSSGCSTSLALANVDDACKTPQPTHPFPNIFVDPHPPLKPLTF